VSARPLLVVTGTRREAATIAGPGVVTLAGGGSRARLMAELEQWVPQSCGVLSFGMAGALDPALVLGDWVVGTRVVGEWQGACDPVFGGSLARRLRTGRRLPASGAILAGDRLIARAEEKAALHGDSGAIAADMESHLAGAAAAAHGVRFAVLRCISDEAGADLPPAIAVAMAPGGGLNGLRIAGSILRRPGQVPALLRTTARFKRAFDVLEAGGARVMCG
jgi:uridine phosphorylase